MFSVNQLEKILPDFNEVSMKDRHKYDIVYECIDKYVDKYSKADIEKYQYGDKRIIVGGNASILLLLQMPRTKDDFQYTLYTETSLLHANNLINEIAETIKNKWFIHLRTIVPNSDFSIVVDNRFLVNIFKFQAIPRNATAFNLIRPLIVDSFNNAYKCLVMTPMFHLIGMYRILYSPSNVNEWESTLKYEKILFEYLKHEFDKDVKPNSGGKHKHYFGSADTTQKITTQKITDEIRSRANVAIMKKFITNNTDIALVGDYSLRLLLKTEMLTPIIIIVSSNAIEKDFHKISEVIDEEFNSRIPLVYSVGMVNVIGDHRLTRTSIKMGPETDRKEIMHIYNAASYDLIPVNKVGTSDFIQLGNPFVIMRFLLMDVWALRWVMASGKIDEKFATARIRLIMKNMLLLRTKISTQTRQILGTEQLDHSKYEIDLMYANKTGPYRIFQSSDYIGTLFDEITAKKILIRKMQEASTTHFPTKYHPQKYKKEMGKYRSIEKKINS